MFKRLLRTVLIPVIIVLRFVLTPIRKHYLKPPVFKFQDDTNPDALKILFIGNSLTFTNDLPMVLLRFLQAQLKAPKTGISLEHGFKIHMVVQGGFSLEDHWNYKIASQCIKTGPWDYVVLQEQSMMTTNMEYDIKRHAQLFAEQIKAADAKLVWFGAWSYRDDPEANTSVSTRQFELAERLHAKYVPAGNCWTKSREKRPDIELYTDQIHPSPEGTYLAACAFYSVLTGLSPVGLPFEIKDVDGNLLVDLDPLRGLAVQEAAKEVIFS